MQTDIRMSMHIYLIALASARKPVLSVVMGVVVVTAFVSVVPVVTEVVRNGVSAKSDAEG